MRALEGVSGRKLLITDGVFSMDGDIGPLPELVEVAERFGAIMMVDDAHSSGVLGRNGRGTIDHFGVHGRVDIQVGTLSKAIGVLGGYVCGSRDLIDYLHHRARPFLFSTSHPPAVAAACLAAFDLLEAEPERIEQLWNNTRHFQSGLRGRRVQPRRVGNSDHPYSCRGCRESVRVFPCVVRGGRFRNRHRLPYGAKGQGSNPHDCYGNSHFCAIRQGARRYNGCREAP